MRPGFLQYFLLQCKRMVRQLPATLIVTVLLIASAGLLGSALLEKNSADGPVTRVRVGLVGDFDNEYLGFGLFAIQNMDPSRFSVDFVVYENETSDAAEAEARADLLRGKLSAYVRVPDTFIEGIRRGRIEPIQYVATSGAVSLGSKLTDEIVAAVGELLSATQDAVYGTQSLAEDRLPNMKSWQAGDGLGELYIDQVLHRADLFETEVIHTPTGIDLAKSLLCGVLVLFLMLWGITASGVFARREQELGGMLYARGMGAGEQVAAELCAYLALLLVTLAAIALPTLWALGRFDLESLGLGLTASKVHALLLGLVPVALMAGTLQFLLYELASGVIQSVLLQFLTAVALGYASGCLYPLRFFPEAMQAIAKWLPTGCAISVLGAALKGSGGWLALAGLAVYAALFIAAAVRLRSRRLTSPGL